jgi:hypothetical protein
LFRTTTTPGRSRSDTHANPLRTRPREG